MLIKLDNTELAQCTVWGLQRYMRKLNGNWGGHHYNNSLSFQERVAEEAEGLAAEWAVSKYYNLPFDPETSNEHYKQKADVGNAIEVRWSKWNDGHLIVYEYDRKSDIAVLVIGKSPTYTIKGWIPVAVAQKERYRHATQPTWWVAQHHLQPIETLKASNYANAIN